MNTPSLKSIPTFAPVRAANKPAKIAKGYYFNPVSDSYGYEGMMAKSGWRCIGGVWYYFWSDGTMAANTRVNGYYVNSSGAWVPGV